MRGVQRVATPIRTRTPTPDPDLDSDDLQHIQVIHLARLLICHIKLFMLKYVLARCLSIGFTLPFTVSCFSKIQIGFTFLVPAYLGSPGKGPLNVCSVCSVCRVYTTCSRLNVSINTTLCCKKGAEALHLFSNTVHWHSYTCCCITPQTLQFARFKHNWNFAVNYNITFNFSHHVYLQR